MNIRTPMIRAALATALVGGAFVLPQTPQATAAADSQTMSVEARAPLQATLLPVVSVVAHVNDPDAAAAMHVASNQALSVTLLPTVFVTARATDFAATMPWIIRAGVDTRLAAADEAALSL